MARHPLVGPAHLTVEASWSHSLGQTTRVNTPLDEWSARSRALYLTIHNTHKRQTTMTPWYSNPQTARQLVSAPT